MIKYIFVAFLLFFRFVNAQDNPKLDNPKGEFYYGNDKIPFSDFFQKGDFSYLYSSQKKKIYVLNKENITIAEQKANIKDFVIPYFGICGEQVILQNLGEDLDYYLAQNTQIIPKRKKITKKVISTYLLPISENNTFEVYILNIGGKSKLSKVLLHNKDTLYKDTKTKENRIVNTYPRISLQYHKEKVYFFNADQGIILVFDKQGKLLEEINLREIKDDDIKTFLMSFFVDIENGNIYVATASMVKTYIWQVLAKDSIQKYELDFRLHKIHQIYAGNVYFSMKGEGKTQYIYNRKLVK